MVGPKVEDDWGKVPDLPSFSTELRGSALAEEHGQFRQVFKLDLRLVGLIILLNHPPAGVQIDLG